METFCAPTPYFNTALHRIRYSTGFHEILKDSVYLCCRHLGARPVVRMVDIVLRGRVPGAHRRAPPALRDLARKRAERSAFSGASDASGASPQRLFSHANISSGFLREARSRRTSDDKCSRRALGSRRPPARMRGAHITTNSSRSVSVRTRSNQTLLTK